jgi:hypothetical protein
MRPSTAPGMTVSIEDLSITLFQLKTTARSGDIRGDLAWEGQGRAAYEKAAILVYICK